MASHAYGETLVLNSSVEAFVGVEDDFKAASNRRWYKSLTY